MGRAVCSSGESLEKAVGAVFVVCGLRSAVCGLVSMVEGQVSGSGSTTAVDPGSFWVKGQGSKPRGQDPPLRSRVSGPGSRFEGP
eukprot:3645151-Rhodomonas_salina.4